MKKLIFTFLLLTQQAWAGGAQDLLQSYEAASGKASALRGEQFFNSKHGREWSCSSCHTSTPDKLSQHIVTGKQIEAMAPSANPKRFNDAAKSEKWFKRNCKDVLARECNAQEKADVIAWLLTIK